MLRLAIVFCLMFIATSAIAQEFDVFDFNDFVDPQLRDATFDKDGNLVDPGKTFTIIRASSGAISDYAWRSTPTHDDVGFIHLAGSRYFRDLQSNVKLTLLQERHDNALPHYRLTTQLARYHMSEANTKVKEKGAENVAGRTLVSLAVEENRGANFGSARRFNTELGVEIDASAALKGGRNASGAFVWIMRYQAVPEAENSSARMERSQRLSYEYRFDEYTFRDRFRIDGSFGVGGLRTDRWHWGATRAGIRGSVDIGAVGTLNLAWTPTYVPKDAGRHTTQEVAFFIDRTMFASLHR